MATFSHLPTELVVKIAKNLDKPSDLSAFNLTSHRIHDSAESILYKHGARFFPYLLCWACDAGEYQIAEKLLFAGANPNRPFEPGDDQYEKRQAICGQRGTGITLLHQVYDHLYYLRRYKDIQWVPEPVTPTSDCFYTALHCAAQHGDLPIVELLLDYGAIIDAPACFSFAPEIPRNPVLGQDKNERAEEAQWTPLHLAICNSHPRVAVDPAVVDDLLHQGASTRYNLEDSTLYESICNRNTVVADSTVADYLLHRGASPLCNLKDSNTNALHYAAAYGLTTTMDILVNGEHRVNINTRDSFGLSPLAFAHTRRHSGDTVEWLLRHGAEIDLDLGLGCTVLHLTCYHLWESETIKLIEAGANVNAHIRREVPNAVHNNLCLRPLELCCAMLAITEAANNDAFGTRYMLDTVDCVRISTRLVKSLLARGADVHPHQRSGNSPLVLAAANNQVQIMPLLVNLGANVGQLDAQGCLPLIAAFEGTCDEMSELHEGRGDPLYLAAFWLLKHGSDPNQKNKRGDTAIQLALLKRPADPQVIQLLLNHGAKCYGKAMSLRLGKNPIRRVFLDKNLEVCRVLMKHEVTKKKAFSGIRRMFYDLVGESTASPRTEEYIQYAQDAIRFLLEFDEESELLRNREHLWNCISSVADVGIAEIMLDAGVMYSLDWETKGQTLLHKLCNARTDKRWKLAQRLIDGGADVNRGSPALLAMEKKVKDLYFVLIANGAKVPFEDPWGSFDDPMWPEEPDDPGYDPDKDPFDVEYGSDSDDSDSSDLL